jgi:hypothetical protein
MARSRLPPREPLATEELGRMDCGELADIAAELALGAVTGRERAQALAHLDQCRACRERVGRLMTTGERLLALLPGIEPPPGFETRVLERIAPARQDPGSCSDSPPNRHHPAHVRHPELAGGRGTAAT